VTSTKKTCAPHFLFPITLKKKKKMALPNYEVYVTATSLNYFYFAFEKSCFFSPSGGLLRNTIYNTHEPRLIRRRRKSQEPKVKAKRNHFLCSVILNLQLLLLEQDFIFVVGGFFWQNAPWEPELTRERERERERERVHKGGTPINQAVILITAVALVQSLFIQ